MKVVIIGSGNVATVVGKLVKNAGNQILQVAGRNIEKVALLAKELNAEDCSNLNKISTLADIYLVAVSDSSIDVIARQLRLKDKMIVHTAGSIPKAVLSDCSDSYGVIYPLQSFRKELKHLPSVPVFIDANNDESLQLLKHFTAGWASSVEIADDERRLKMHVAAVMVNNFTNHIFTVTNQFCEEEHLNFNCLYPLIEETIERIKENQPSAVQTGPAVRNDFLTIEKHLSVLSRHHYLKELYKIISSNIIDFYSTVK